VFFTRHLATFFREYIDLGFSNTSRESWLDVERPINIYKCLGEILVYLRLGLQPKTLLLLLSKYFVMPMDVVTGVRPCPKDSIDVGYYLIGELPQVLSLIIRSRTG